MRRRRAVKVAICTLVAGGILTTPALADTPGCVTKPEFRKAKHGMAVSRVASIFDTNGKLSFRSGPYMSRKYKPCRRFASISVDYKHRRVTHKTGFWA